MRIVFLVLVTMGALWAQFIRSGDVVMDTKRVLIWQDNIEIQAVEKSWSEAIAYCEGLEFGGHTNWRLPNIWELNTIVDRSLNRPAIVPILKNNMSPMNTSYWTSTAHSHIGYAYFINFHTGQTWRGFKSEKKLVRCVQ